MNNNMINDDSQKNTDRRTGAKKIWVRKSALSEFSIKTRSIGGVLIGGEISCPHLNETGKISDMPDIIKFIEEKCDLAGYPQSQRKLRGWELDN